MQLHKLNKLNKLTIFMLNQYLETHSLLDVFLLHLGKTNTNFKNCLTSTNSLVLYNLL